MVQDILKAVQAASVSKADQVLPELIQGSEPTVEAVVSAVFSILQAGADAGLEKIPFGTFAEGEVNHLIQETLLYIDEYIRAKASSIVPPDKPV